MTDRMEMGVGADEGAESTVINVTDLNDELLSIKNPKSLLVIASLMLLQICSIYF